MPSTASTNLPDPVEKAVHLLGNPVRVAVLRSLRTGGPATRKELANRLGISTSLLQTHLRILESHGVVTPSPPRSEPGRLWRTYTVNVAEVDGMLDNLTRTLRPG